MFWSLPSSTPWRMAALRCGALSLDPAPLPDLHPLPIPRRRLDGIEHTLILVAVLEARRGQLLLYDGAQKIVHGVRERVLVADDVPRRPPRAHVRVFSVGDRDGAKAA